MCKSLVMCTIVIVLCILLISLFFFFKQKTAYEMRISDWSSDVCYSDLTGNSALLHEPWTVQTRSKGWFRVFSPFWRACRAGPEPAAQIGRASCRERVCQYG